MTGLELKLELEPGLGVALGQELVGRWGGQAPSRKPVPSNVAAAPTPPRCKPAAASEPLHELPTEEFELIVVDGGHAGSEVALTTARLGIRTALFSISLDRVAWQPCNPAVGRPLRVV